MLPFQIDSFGNASSVHALGRQAKVAVEQARASVAAFIGAQQQEIFFTPNATFSNNAALLGRARYVEERGLGRHLITSSIEHSSALEPAKYLEKRGWRITYLEVDSQGFIDLKELERAIADDTSILSIIWGNNEVGTLQPIHQINDIASERNIFFHTDAVQVAGKLPIDVRTLGIDSLSLSGHKFHAPKGIGILFKREGAEILPIVFGGGQEGGLSPGTEGVANIVGIGKAAEIAGYEIQKNSTKLKKLQQILIQELLQSPKIKLTGPTNLRARVPGHVSIVVSEEAGSELVLDADVRGLRISSASACSSGDKKVSHVLKALGVSSQLATSSLRITAGKLNSEDECRTAARIIRSIIQPEFVSAPQLNAPVAWAY